jgi:hypothetical protein
LGAKQNFSINFTYFQILIIHLSVFKIRAKLIQEIIHLIIFLLDVF